MIWKPPIERDMDMAEAEEASGVVGWRSGGTTQVSFLAANEPWGHNKNVQRVRNVTSEPVSAPGDCRSWMVWIVRQQVHEVTQLYRTNNRTTQRLEAHMAHEQGQWRGMKEWLENRETKWDDRHGDNVLWGAGIPDMMAKVLAKARGGKAAPTVEVRKKGRNETARQNGEGLEAAQHAGQMQGGEPEKRQLQQQPKPKPKLQLKQQSEQQHEPKPKPTPTPARRWKTVQPRTLSQRTPTGPGPAPTSWWSVAARWLIILRDEGLLVPNMMTQEIALAMNKALFKQKALGHIRIMNAKRNAKGAIMEFPHHRATVEMALPYRDLIITAAWMVDKGVIDVEEHESSERLKVHAVPLMRFIGKGTEGLHKMQDEIHVDNERVAIPIQVRWLANPHSFRQTRERGEISASSVLIVLQGDKLARRQVKQIIEAAGVWYRVEQFTSVSPDSRCEQCCGWGHIESKCCGKLAYGYCWGPHRTSADICNIVGCIAMQGSLCSHTEEKCPKWEGNHITFSSRCAKKAEATREAPERRRCEPAGWTKKTAGPPSGANRTALGPRARAPESGERGGSEEEMADAEEGGAEPKDITMVESTTPTTMAMPAPSATETAMAVGTGIEPRNLAGVIVPNGWSDPTQMRQVIRMGHGHAGDWGGPEGGCVVSARATKRQFRKQNHVLRIWH